MLPDNRAAECCSFDEVTQGTWWRLGSIREHDPAQTTVIDMNKIPVRPKTPTTHLNMAKRKRSDGSPAPAPVNHVKQQRKQCEARIAAAQKPLVTALRAGAGLERQKHSRRKKTATAKKDTKGLARLEAEYAVLKSLNMEKVAEQHVRRTIAKVKSIKEHEAIPESAREIEKGSQDPATLNVLARLYKIPAVRKEVDAVIDDLKAIVTGTANAENAEKSEPKRARGHESDDDGDDDDDDDAFSSFNARIAAPSSGEESEGEISGDERPPSIGSSAGSHDPEDDLNFGDDSEDDGDSSSDSPPSDFAGFSSDSDTISIPRPKRKTPDKPDKPTTASAFIPALSHAAYISGSESDASDLDAEIAPRKNRRGQRARQKIAEAKFGAGAKHVQKAARDKGWDPKRGAINDDGARRGGRGPVMSGENAMPLGGRKVEKKKGERDDKGELHPSWQAAKAVKESKKLVIDVKGAGAKKVVFD
jgi:hypothetical protein